MCDARVYAEWTRANIHGTASEVSLDIQTLVDLGLMISGSTH
jgi:hypothetical protein